MKGIKYYRPEIFNRFEIKTCSNVLHSYREHVHEELSFAYIEKGTTILNVRGKDYYIEAGEAVIIFPYVSHRCQPVDINDWKFTMVYIGDKLYKQIINSIDKKSSIRIKKLNDFELNRVKQLLNYLENHTNIYNREVKLINTLIQLFNTCHIDIQYQSDKKINSIKKYIEDHFLEEIRLKDIEDRFEVNKFVLIRNFKNKFNTTPSAYQLQLKINYGKHLLKDSDDIVDIALKSGFYDQAHFTKEFKKAYGITPLQYRKALKNQ